MQLKEKQLNYYTITYKEKFYALIIEEDYKQEKFKAWIETPEKKKFIMYETIMHYQYYDNEITPYDNEYLLFQDIAEKNAKVYIRIWEEMRERVQLSENNE